MLADPAEFSGIWRGGEPDVNCIEVGEGGAMSVIDRTVALVRDHEIKIRMSKAAGTELSRDRIECSDYDLPFKASFAAVEQFTGVIPQVIIERFLGLLRELDPIRKEEHPRNGGGLKPPLHQHRYGQRFASAGGHLKKHPAAP